MPFRIRAVPNFPVVEEYETTFADWQVHNDSTRWRGTGDCAEFPHNAGSLEEKIDEQQDRKIITGGGGY